MKQYLVSRSPANQFAGWAFLVLAMLVTPVWAAVGYVHEATGSVFMQQGSAPERTVTAGQSFDPGATFRTGANGNLVLKFEDGQLSTLRPDSSFRVDQFSFNPKNPSAGNSAITLLTGAMRFVTGLVGSTNRGNVRIATRTATIGIRGTDLVFDSAGNAFVLVGGISLTPGGATQPILISLGQFASPVSTTPSTAVPGFFQASANALASQTLPANTPPPQWPRYRPRPPPKPPRLQRPRPLQPQPQRKTAPPPRRPKKPPPLQQRPRPRPRPRKPQQRPPAPRPPLCSWH
jgi:hypothetical protein